MQHSTLIEAMQQAVVATDLEGRVTYWNACAERLYGWSSSEAVGRAVDELLRPQTFTAADDLIRTAMHGGKSWSGEYIVTRRDDTQIATFVTVSPLFDATHTRLIGVVGVTEDATERRKSLADRERLSAIVSSSDDALVVWDLDGRITSWNAGAERIYGYSAAEMLGIRRHRLVPAERGHEVRQMVERVARGERIDHLETQRLRKDGCTIDVSMSALPLRDMHGTVTEVAVIARDITAQKAYERQLQDAEQRLRSLFANHPDAVFALDRHGRYTELNPACERLSGIPAEQLVGTPIGEHSLERQLVLDSVRTALDGTPLTFEATLVNHDKRSVPVQATLVPILVNGSAVGVYGITKDISARKRIELRLATQAREQMAIADLGLLALTDIGTDELLRMTVELVAATLDLANVALLEYCSDASTFSLRDGVGVPEPLIDATIANPTLQAMIEHPDSSRIDARTLHAMFAVPGLDLGKRPFGLASRIPGRDANHGLLVGWSRRARAFSEDDLRFLQEVGIVLGAAIDHYRAADELRRRESEFKVLVEHTSDNIARFDHLLRYVYVNPALQRVLGVPSSELVNRRIAEVHAVHPHDVDGLERGVRRVLRTGEEEQLEIAYADRCYQVRFSPEFGPDDEVKSVLCVGRDITAEKRREAERSKLYQELLERDERLHGLMERMLLDQQQPKRARTQSAALLEQFNTRDRDILRLLARGLTNRQIGKELGLQPSTVKNYVANLLPRLNASDRTNAAVVAAQLGLLD